MPARGKTQGIPPVAGVKDPAVARILSALRENAIANEARQARGQSSGGAGGPRQASGQTPSSPGVRPNPPLNLAAQGIFGAVILEVEAIPASAAAIEWLAAPDDDLSQAKVVGQSAVPLFRHYVGDDTKRWYWARAVGFGESGLRSALNQTAGTPARSAKNVDLIISNLNEQIGRDQLVDDITSTIDLVTAGPDVPGSVAAQAEAVRDDLNQRADLIDEQISQTRDDLAESAEALQDRVDDTNQSVAETREYVGRTADALGERVDAVGRDARTINLITPPGQAATAYTRTLLRERRIEQSLTSEIEAAEIQARDAANSLADRALTLEGRADELRADLDEDVADRQAQVNRLTTDLSQEVQDRIGADDAARAARQTETTTRQTEDDRLVETLTTLFAIGGSRDPVYRRADQVPDNPPPGAYRIIDTDAGPALERYQDSAWRSVEGFDADSIRATIANNQTVNQNRDDALARDVSLLESGLSSAQQNIDANSQATAAVETQAQNNADGISANATNNETLRSDLTDLETGQTAQADTLSSHGTRITQTETEQVAQSERLDAVESGVSDARAGLDAASTARDQLSTETRQNADTIETQGQRLVDVESGLTDAQQGVDANTQATSALDTRTTSTEQEQTAQGQRLDAIDGSLTTLDEQTQLNANAANGLDTRLTNTEDEQTAQAGRLGAVESGLSDANSGLDAASTARDGLDTRITANKESTETVAARTTALESGLSDAEAGVDANTQATDDLRNRVILTEDRAETTASNVIDLRGQLVDTQNQQAAQGDAINALKTTSTRQGDELSQQSANLIQVSSRLDQISETGAENLLGADADDEAEAKTVALDLASTTLGSGDLVSAYGEFQHATDVTVDFVIDARDSAGTVLDTLTTGGVGGPDYEAAKVQGFKIPASAATLHLTATAGTARYFSLNRGPLAVVFRAPSATAEALGDLRSTVNKQGETLESTSQDVTKVQSGVSALDSQQQANTSLLDSVDTLSRQNADEITTQGGRLTKVESGVEDTRNQANGNAGAIDGIDTRVSSTEQGQIAQANRLSDVEAGLSAAEQGVSGNARALDDTTLDVQRNADEIDVQAGRTTEIEGRVASVETGEQANSRAIEDVQTQSTNNADELSTQADRLAGVESDLGNTQSDVAANTHAAEELSTRSLQTAARLETAGRRIESIDAELVGQRSISLVTPPGKSVSAATKNLANARAITQTDSRVTETQDTLESVGNQVTLLENGLTDVEQGVNANATANDEIRNRVTSTEQQQETESERVTALSNELSNTQDQAAANTDATNALGSRITQTEEGLESTASDLTALQNRAQTADGERQANANAVGGLRSDIEVIDGTLRATNERATELESRVRAFSIRDEMGFEDGEKGLVAAPTGWELEGQPQIATYYTDAFSDENGSRLAYGNDGSGPSPGAWGIKRMFALQEGGGRADALFKTRIISGYCYGLLSFYDEDGDLISQHPGQELTTDYNGHVEIHTDAPANARNMALSLRASRLTA